MTGGIDNFSLLYVIVGASHSPKILSIWSYPMSDNNLMIEPNLNYDGTVRKVEVILPTYEGKIVFHFL